MRSDYFRILLTNADFKEGRYNNKILSEGSLLESRAQELQVGFADPEVVATALIWMYTDHLPKDLPSDHLLEARQPDSLLANPVFCTLTLSLPFGSQECALKGKAALRAWPSCVCSQFTLVLQALSISVALMCEGLKQKCAVSIDPSHVKLNWCTAGNLPFLPNELQASFDLPWSLQAMAQEEGIQIRRRAATYFTLCLQLLLQPHVTVGTAIPFLAEAMSLEADRLADACLYVIAQNLKSLVGQPEFAELVQASATSVAKRQDVDSVPIVDDIRYFITQIHGEDAAGNLLVHTLSCLLLPPSGN